MARVTACGQHRDFSIGESALDDATVIWFRFGIPDRDIVAISIDGEIIVTGASVVQPGLSDSFSGQSINLSLISPLSSQMQVRRFSRSGKASKGIHGEFVGAAVTDLRSRRLPWNTRGGRLYPIARPDRGSSRRDHR